MKHPPLITLSIVSHGDADKVAHLLASLQTVEPDSEKLQIFLTDNLGNELPEFDILPWSSLHVLRNERPLGFAHNHNRALKHAEGKYFAILNPDLVFERPVFQSMLDRLSFHPDAIIAPQMTDDNGHVQDSFRLLPTPLELIQRRLHGYRFQPLTPDNDGLIHPDWVAAMFWFMKSDTFTRLSGLDEKFWLYFEDVDFCTRARLAGMKVLVDTRLSVRHDAQRSSRRKLYYLALHTRSALKFFTSPVYRQARNKKR